MVARVEATIGLEGVHSPQLIAEVDVERVRAVPCAARKASCFKDSSIYIYSSVFDFYGGGATLAEDTPRGEQSGTSAAPEDFGRHHHPVCV